MKSLGHYITYAGDIIYIQVVNAFHTEGENSP